MFAISYPLPPSPRPTLSENHSCCENNPDNPTGDSQEASPEVSTGAMLEEPLLAKLQQMEKVAERVEKHTVEIKEFKQQITKMVTSTNNNLSNLTERINKLKQGIEKHELANDMATLNQNIASLEKDVGQQVARLESSTDAKLKEPLDKLQEMEKIAKCVEKHTEDIKGINDNLVTGIAHITERVSHLEINALSQNLVKDMATFNQKLVSLQKDMGQQASLPNRVTSLEQRYHNLSSRLGRMQELTDKIIPLEQLVEEIRDGTNNDLPMCKICKARPCAMTFRCWQQKQP